MKYLPIIIVFLLFVQCDADRKEKKETPLLAPTVSGFINQDTFYLDEKCHGKIFMVNKPDSISNLKFFYNGIYLPQSGDTANYSFTVKDIFSTNAEKIDYTLKLLYKRNGILDSSSITKSYYVSKALLNSRAIGMIKNNKREGLWKFWYDNQHLFIARVTLYKNGLRHGVEYLFHDPLIYKNNTLQIEQHYRDGLKHGSYIEYQANGNILSKGSYTNNSSDGKFVNYSSSGNVLQ